MKKAILALCCAGLMWAGCREKDPFISFGGTPVAGIDSAYMGPVPDSTYPHNVLVEEFTGQSCPNCPSAHTTLDGIAGLYAAGRVNVISMYVSAGPQSNAPSGAKYYFISDTATQIAGAIFGAIGQLPTGFVDRIPYNSSVLTYATDWADIVKNQKDIIDSVNLELASSYNAGSGVATIKGTVTYTKPMTTKQNISIYVVEDSLYDLQENASGGYYNNYLFMDVFRSMVSAPPLGDAVLDTMLIKKTGQVYWRKYTYKPDASKIKASNCRIVAFVNSPGTGGDYRVLQSVQCRLVP